MRGGRQIVADVLGRFVGLKQGLFVVPAVRLLLRLGTRSLKASTKLKILFSVENDLYAMLGGASVEYGNGEHSKHRHIAFHDFFVDRLQPGERVYDVGCGEGMLALSMAKNVAVMVTAVDMDAAKILVAKQRRPHEKIVYRVVRVQDDREFGRQDVVVMSNVLEHVEKRVELLRKLKQNLNPKRFLIRVPCFDRDWRVPLKKELGVDWRLDSTHEIEYTRDSFESEVGEAGLTVEELNVQWGEIWAVLK